MTSGRFVGVAHGHAKRLGRINGQVTRGRCRTRLVRPGGVRRWVIVKYVLQLVAGRARELYDAQAKERQKESGKTHGRGKVVEHLPQPIGMGSARDAAGKAVGVSGKSESQRALLAAKLVNSHVGGDHSANLRNAMPTRKPPRSSPSKVVTIATLLKQPRSSGQLIARLPPDHRANLPFDFASLFTPGNDLFGNGCRIRA